MIYSGGIKIFPLFIIILSIISLPLRRQMPVQFFLSTATLAIYESLSAILTPLPAQGMKPTGLMNQSTKFELQEPGGEMKPAQ